LHQLLEATQEQPWQIARTFTRDWDEAADLAQDILIETAHSLPLLQDPARFPAWNAILGRRVGHMPFYQTNPVSVGDLIQRSDRDGHDDDIYVMLAV
jgi:hypothetical protein